MDRAKLSTGQKLVFYGGLFLIVNLLFIPWYRAGAFFSFGDGINGFGAGFYAWFGSLCGIAAAALVYLKASGRGKLGTWPVKAELLILALAAAAFVLFLVRLIIDADFVFLGLILGLIVAGLMAFGAFLDSGLKLPQGKPAAAAPAEGELPPPPPPPPA